MFISFGLGATVSCNMARHTLRSVCGGWNGPKLLLHGKQLYLFTSCINLYMWLSLKRTDLKDHTKASVLVNGLGREVRNTFDLIPRNWRRITSKELTSPQSRWPTDWTHASCIKCDPDPHALTNPWNETFTMRVTHLTWSEVPHHTRMRRAQPWMEPELKPC